MLITEAYRDLNARHHFEAQEWGLQSIKYWLIVKNICEMGGFKSLLDYGCGKRALERALTPHGIKVTNYDPAFPEIASPPEPHDFVVCTDVLEHVEPECIDDVVKDLHRVMRKCGFFVIATRPSLKSFADGSNPHRIIEGKGWWLQKLEPYFEPTGDAGQSEKYFSLIVKPKVLRA